MNVDYLDYCPTCLWCCNGENLYLSEKEKEALGEDQFSGAKSEGSPCEKLNSNGLCSIHHKRPIECRLFPFDLLLAEDGSIDWVLWVGHCPAAKAILPKWHEATISKWEEELTDEWVRGYTSFHSTNQPKKYDKNSFLKIRKWSPKA